MNNRTNTECAISMWVSKMAHGNIHGTNEWIASSCNSCGTRFFSQGDAIAEYISSERKFAIHDGGSIKHRNIMLKAIELYGENSIIEM